MKHGKWMRAAGKVFFVLYACFLIYFLLFSDWYGRGLRSEFSYNLIPFKEIQRFYYNADRIGYVTAFGNLAGNILIFVPFGFFTSMGCYRYRFLRSVCFGFLCSLLVECFQLVTKVGSFDVDDMILNTAGALIGYVLFTVWRMFGSRKKR